MGVAKSNEKGIDAIAFSSGILKDITGLSLKVTDGTSLQAPLDRAALAAVSAVKGGYAGKNVELYIKAENLTAEGVAKFAVGGNQGLLNIVSRERVFKSITIFAKDGIVRIQNGKVDIERPR